MSVLTAHKSVMTLREGKLADMPVITLFLRDGFIWFIVVFCNSSKISAAYCNVHIFVQFSTVLR